MGDRSGIGGSLVGHCRDAARRSSPILPSVWPKNLPATDGKSTGHRPAIAGALQPARLLHKKKNRWAMPKFQRRPSRLLIGRSLLWFVTIALPSLPSSRKRHCTPQIYEAMYNYAKNNDNCFIICYLLLCMYFPFCLISTAVLKSCRCQEHWL